MWHRVVFVLSCVFLREDYLPFRINDPFVVACLCVCDCLPRGQFVNSVCDFLVVVPPFVLSIKDSDACWHSSRFITSSVILQNCICRAALR